MPEFLTAPFPADVSLQSALYLYGMVSQVPSVTHAVTLTRTRRFATPLGAVSLHHVKPAFFFGYEDAGRTGGRLATPEKALVDFLYRPPGAAVSPADWRSSWTSGTNKARPGGCEGSEGSGLELCPARESTIQDLTPGSLSG